MNSARLALCLSALLTALPSLASAQAPPAPAPGDTVYTVRPGDTCMGIVRRVYGDPRYLDFYHASNPSLGPSPHRLVAGTQLVIPAKPPVPPGAPDARLTALRNQVETFTPARHPGQRNEPLSRGHRVSTLAASSAEVTFIDENRLQLGEHTLIVILGDAAAGAPSASAADTTLLSGALRAHLSELAGSAHPMPVATAAGRATVGPGEAQLSVDEKHSTRLAVYRGRSRLRASGKEVTVNQGYGSRADEGRPPTAPRRLPLAPAWVRAPASLLLARGPIDVTAEYRPGAPPPGSPSAGSGSFSSRDQAPPPAAWHVQLARDDRFNDLIVDAKVPLAVTTLSATQVGEGRYFARVSAIDDDQFEGPFLEAATVRVVPARLVPAATPTQSGRLEVPPDIFCGVDGAPLARVTTGAIELAPGPHQIACASDDHGAASGSLAVEVPAAPAQPAPTQPAPATPPAATPKAAAPAPSNPVAAAPTPPTPAAARERLEGVELGPLLMLRSDDSLHAASAPPVLGLELGVRFRLPWGQLAVALRGTYDHQDDSAAHFALAGALPIQFRFARPEALVTPYLAFVPQLVWEQPSAAATSAGQGLGRPLRAGLGGAVGVQLRAGPGGLFLEVGYNRGVGRAAAPGDLPDDTFSLALGYRFRLGP